jgi:hypothetical protein
MGTLKLKLNDSPIENFIEDLTKNEKEKFCYRRKETKKCLGGSQLILHCFAFKLGNGIEVTFVKYSPFNYWSLAAHLLKFLNIDVFFKGFEQIFGHLASEAFKCKILRLDLFVDIDLDFKKVFETLYYKYARSFRLVERTTIYIGKKKSGRELCVYDNGLKLSQQNLKRKN